jgi:hypothetical protein
MRRIVTLMLACATIAPVCLRAQATDEDLELLRLLATPITALPPLALQMPASRNHSYIIARLQSGYREGPYGSNMSATAVGLDYQILGGSVIGVTGGFQNRDCKVPGVDCGKHALFGARTQLNLITGGSMMAALLHDNSTTSTIGAEFGFGYAPKVANDLNSCTIDAGLPLNIAKRRQRPRLTAFVKPGMIWDFSCGSGGPPSRKSYFTDFGLGLQQVAGRGLDIYVGAQKIFRARTGLAAGVTITYVKLP